MAIDIDALKDSTLSAILNNLDFDESTPERQEAILAELRNSRPRELMARWMEWHGIIGYYDSVVDAWEDLCANDGLTFSGLSTAARTMIARGTLCKRLDELTVDEVTDLDSASSTELARTILCLHGIPENVAFAALEVLLEVMEVEPTTPIRELE
jgi:hypothetical protein